MSEPMLKVSGLNAFYGRAHILFDVGLEVGRGEVVALMGRNGAGKSTTMKAVMGLLPRRQGEVTFRGQNISALPPYKISRMGMGFVPEDRRVFARSDRDGESRHRPSAAARRRASAGRRKSCSGCFRISAKCPRVRAAR